jgi:hypothetical protein
MGSMMSIIVYLKDVLKINNDFKTKYHPDAEFHPLCWKKMTNLNR